MNINKLLDLFNIARQPLLKALQYLSIFTAWMHQRNNNKDKFDYYFSIYQKIFHSRKLFRLFKTIIYIPQITKIFKQLKTKITFMKIFQLLGKVFTAIFYALDNATIITMIMGYPYYKTVRRISHIILFFGLLFTTIALFIQLRHSFKRQGELKADLQNLTPTQLLQNLTEIDENRFIIGIKLVRVSGDLFPTLARTNLPQIVVRTKINKGTVGFFGTIAALTSLYLKLRGQIEIK